MTPLRGNLGAFRGQIGGGECLAAGPQATLVLRISWSTEPPGPDATGQRLPTRSVPRAPGSDTRRPCRRTL